MATIIRTKINKKITTNDEIGNINGYLIPIYNINDVFISEDKRPEQVYITTIMKGCCKGPHLHLIRTGYFTCIVGDIKIVLKTSNGYEEFYSGENYEYLTVEIPTGIPALVINICDREAFVLNMPNPAWNPNMNDEHTSDFDDYFTEQNIR